MKKIWKISVAALLAMVLLVSAMPALAVSTTPANVKSAEELVAALAAGHTNITVQGRISIYETIAITRDVTITADIDPDNPWLGAGISFSKSGAPGAPSIEAGFVIAPTATLTIDTHDHLDQIGIDLVNGALFLLEADSASAAGLVINDGQLMAHDETSQVSENCVMFKSAATTGTKTPTVVLKDGLFRNGSFSSGDIDFSIEAGEYSIDPTAYLATNAYALHHQDSAEDSYEVVQLATTFSDGFKKHMDADGNFVIKRYHPSLDGDYEQMLLEFDSMFEEYMPDGEVGYKFQDYDKQQDTALVCRSYSSYNGGSTREYHVMQLKFVYDATRKEDIDKVIEKVTKNPDDPWDFNWYAVTDLELVNYWLADSKGEADGTAFLLFSSEFRKVFDNKNYGFYLSSRLGSGSPMETAEGGEGLFLHDGVVYGSTHIGAEAQHILYVPTETENTVAAKKAAVQKKLDGFLGAGAVTVEATTIGEAQLYLGLYELYYDPWNLELMDAEFPGHTFEKWMNGEYPGTWPAGFPHPGNAEDEAWEEFYNPEYGYTSLPAGFATKDDPCFTLTLNGKMYIFEVECDSTKMVDAPKYQSVDAATAVSVSTESAEVPLDTLVTTQQLTSGAEYDRIVKILDVAENVTYDITLYSETAGQSITKLANGQFEVKLPVPASLEGKSLVVYYVNDEDEVEEHTATVSGGFATFTTDHFSVYTLAEAKTAGSVEVTIPKDEASVEIGKDVVDAAAADGKSLAVTNNDGVTATFDAKALETISSSAKAGDKVSIQVEVVEASTLTADQQKTVKDLDTTLVLSASVLVGGKEVADFKGGEVTVEIPFAPAEGMRLEDYTLVYIHDDGRVEIVPTKVVGGKLYATLTHFSEYAVVKTASAQSFVAQQKPLTSPATGDVLPMGVFALVASAALAAVLLVNRKRLMQQ